MKEAKLTNEILPMVLVVANVVSWLRYPSANVLLSCCWLITCSPVFVRIFNSNSFSAIASQYAEGHWWLVHTRGGISFKAPIGELDGNLEWLIIYWIWNSCIWDVLANRIVCLGDGNAGSCCAEEVWPHQFILVPLKKTEMSGSTKVFRKVHWRKRTEGKGDHLWDIQQPQIRPDESLWGTQNGPPTLRWDHFVL